MNITRLVELSLYYHIQKTLSRKRIKEEAFTSDYKTYQLKGKNIIPDETIEVYVNDTLVDKSLYAINCFNGTVIMQNSLSSSDKVSVTYSYCPVNMYDEGINPLGDDFKMPAVAVYESDRELRGFELGNPKKESVATWIVEVWCERGGERNDITDMIVDSLYGDIFIIDYNDGFPINQDGTINTNFDQSNIITSIYADSINYNKTRSLDIGDKPIYFSEIMVDFVIPPSP